MIQELIFKQEEDHYKPARVGNAFSSNYIEYKSNGDKGKILTLKDYLNVIRPYLSHMINDHKTQSEWKIKLTMRISFFSSKDSEETRIMYSPSDYIEIMMGSETDEIIEKPFKSLLQRCQEGLEESMKGSEFVFDSLNSPKWLKHKKATINIKNNNDKFFQYAITVALNHEEIKKDPQRITKIKPFIDQYN